MSGEWFCVNGSAASRAFMTCVLNNQQRSEPLGGRERIQLAKVFRVWTPRLWLQPLATNSVMGVAWPTRILLGV